MLIFFHFLGAAPSLIGSLSMWLMPQHTPRLAGMPAPAYNANAPNPQRGDKEVQARAGGARKLELT